MNQGRRKYECADCKGTQMEHSLAMQRRNRPRCKSCGSTFLNPHSKLAIEAFENAAAARAIVQPILAGKKPQTGRENRAMSDIVDGSVK